MRKERKTTSFANERRSNRGFTLVELIVVLAILAILAAIGVMSVTGYINRSKLDKNNQNAITVYQAAQAALSQKVENGTISDWTSGTLLTCNGLVGNGFPVQNGKIVGLENVNDSRHTTVALTFNMGLQNTQDTPSYVLFNLLSPYFYDQSVFNGTITVVFDVSVTYQGEGEDLLYSANVLATYYSLENSVNPGWDPAYIHSESDLALDDSEPWSSLPCTKLSCRYTSFVGFYNGTEESLVGPVVVRDDPSDASGTLFTLRNGETLDVTWCVFDEGHDPNITLDFYNADSTSSSAIATIVVNETSLDSAVASATTTSYESVSYTVHGESQDYSASCGITRTYQEGLATVTLQKPNADDLTITVPVTKTEVSGDTRSEITSYLGTGATTYTTYTLSLDCMMTRGSYSSSPAAFSSTRIFGDNPLNVCAAITVGNRSQTAEPLYATRAIDDPIYCTGVGRVTTRDGVRTGYIYDATSDSHIGRNERNNKCIVNTLFGDYNYNDDGVQSNPISGYRTNSQNQYDVAITSARHLSNIRLINANNSSKKYHYHIVSDINWYYPATDTTMPTSEVRVYTSDGNYNSPVENGELKVVSFPAINVLNSYETLSAERSDPYNGGEFCSINNVQMRVASFVSSDAGYALIGENKGCIYNIRTDNFNLVLTNSVQDGDSSDYDSIHVEDFTIDGTGSRCGLAQKPVGGLIGLNSGTVGVDAASTIVMDNCVVMAGEYWHVADYGNDSNNASVGGVIGKNNVAIRYGSLELSGYSIIVGARNVGGVIGLNLKDIGATLSASIEGVIGSAPIRGVANTGNNVGGVIGLNSAKVNADLNSVVSGTITGNEGVGGVIGKNSKAITKTVTVTVEGTIRGSKNVGGAMGFSAENLTISRIVATINGTAVISATGDGVGGVIGDNKSTLSAIQLTFASTAKIAGKGSIGGVIGFNESQGKTNGVLNVEIAGTITATGDCVGGVIGQNVGEINKDIEATITGVIISTNSSVGGVIGYNNGTVKAALTSIITGSITGKDNIGGVIGRSVKAISNKLTSTITGSIIGGKNVGGAIGSNENSVSAQIKVDIKGSGSISSTGDNVGGAVGYNKSTLSGIQLTFESSSVITGKSEVGGVIGYNDGGTLSSALDVTINGSINATGNNVGGIIGNNNGTVSSTLKVTVTGSITGIEGVGGIIGKNSKTISNKLTSIISGNISGKNNVGGAIGISIENITVSQVETSINGTAAIVGIGDNVGGVFGTNKSEVSSVQLAAFESSAKITGNNSVGGVFGYNSGAVSCALDVTVGGTVTANTSNAGGVIGSNDGSMGGTITSRVNGVVQGPLNVGGAIGSNTVAISNDINVQINSNAKVISATQNADNNVGGAIGYNSGSVINVNVNVDGTLTGSGNNIGGAIGNNIGTISNMVANIGGSQQLSGVNNVGGVIGNNTGTVTYSTAVVTPIDVRIAVSGTTNIGGVIGYNKGGVNFAASTESPLKINNSVSGTENVGGVIGDNHYSVSGLVVTVNSTVQGSKNIGGAIGSNDAAIANNITVAISNTGKVNGTTANADNNVGGVIGSNSGNVSSLTVNNGGTLSGRGHNVGGVIGTNSGTITNLLPSVDGTSPITCSGKNVGGVIGYNNGTVTFNTSSGTPFVVNASVTGGENVGGVIGSNAKPVNGLNVTIGGTVQGTMSVGGAIGSNSSNPAITSNITVTINGIVRVSSGATSAVNNVGGVIGINNGSIGSDTSPVVFSLTVNGTLSGVGKNIGGIIGCNKGTIKNFTSNVSGTSSLSGYRNVGGVIGSNEASVSFNTASATPSVVNLTITGTENVGGVIGSNTKPVSGLNVTVSGTIQGSSCVGGVVAFNSGDFNVATTTASSPITISASIIGVTNVGGVIGQQNSGTINGIGTQTAPITLTNVTISGQNGVGGVVGNMKGGTINNGIYITATTSSITGVTNVGGVFGQQSAGTINGIGTQTAPVALTDVTIFGQNGVGGVVGYMNGGTNNSGIYLTVTSSHIDGTSQVGGAIGYLKSGTFKGGIHETLDASYITGVEAVGGGIGMLQGSINGGMEVNLVNNTNIGDIVSGGDYHCIDVGGAIGFVDRTAGIYSGRIVVTIEEGMIFAGGTTGIAGGISVDQAGVGGVFGRLGSSSNTATPDINNWNTNNNCDPYLSLYCESNTPTVCSAGSPVGGLVGHMMGGTIRRSYSTAVVTGSNYVGGFVGRMDGGKIESSYVGGHTVNGGHYEEGNENVRGVQYVGGFAGYVGASVTKIHECYSTASVRGTNYVGGFVGYIENNTDDVFDTTYCTGLISADEPTNSEEIFIGTYAGYVECSNGLNVFKSDRTIYNPHSLSNGNKVLEITNSGRGFDRLGGWSDTSVTSVPQDRLCNAPYNEQEYGGMYIKVRPQSAYSAIPFDEDLLQYVGNYPYRTFISYLLPEGGGYFGEHIGDWPMFGEGGLIIINPTNTQVTIAPPYDRAIDFRYGESEGMRIPREAFTVVYTNPEDGEHTLTTDEYQVICENHWHAGTATWHVVGLSSGGYGGEISQTYQINPANLADTSLFTITVNGESDRTYTGAQIKPSVTVQFHNINTGRTVNVSNSQYVVTYGENTNVGTGTIIVTAAEGADCTGQQVIEFTINPLDISTAEVTLDQDAFEYTGAPIEPSVTSVKVGSMVIPSDSYTVSYSDNIAVGSATVTVTAAEGSNFTGSASTTFTITPNMTDANVSVDSAVYTGNPVSLVVRCNGVVLVEGTDYTVSYPDDQNNTEIATGLSVTITGIGNYAGTVDKYFDIIAESPDPPEITDDTDGSPGDGDSADSSDQTNPVDPPETTDPPESTDPPAGD